NSRFSATSQIHGSFCLSFNRILSILSPFTFRTVDKKMFNLMILSGILIPLFLSALPGFLSFSYIGDSIFHGTIYYRPELHNLVRNTK
ncbi:hypothetical protein PFISCL1PPCAC_6442, partial [Pristionchus fissidentatus]